MSTELVPLFFEEHEIRVVWVDGKRWWVLADICVPLDYGLPTNASRLLADDEKDIHVLNTLGGPQEMLIISTPGLFKLVQSSRKPAAKRFDRWVRHEVLVSIEETGSFSVAGGNPIVDCLKQLLVGQEAIREAVKGLSPKMERACASAIEKSPRIDRIDGNVIHLATKGREDPTPETEEIHGSVIDHHYYGCCPFNKDLKIRENGKWIIGPDGKRVMDIHHQYNKNDGRLEATIPLHRESHKKVEKKKENLLARARLAVIFNEYQNCVSRLLEARGLVAPIKQLEFPLPGAIPTPSRRAKKRAKKKARESDERANAIVLDLGNLPDHTGYYKDIAIRYSKLNPHVKDPAADVRNGIYRYCDCKAHHTPKCQHLPILFVYVSPGTYKLTELGEQRLKELNAPRL